MTNTNQAMGIKVSSEIVQQVKLRMAELESPDDPYKTGWTQENLAEMSNLGLKTVQRFLWGEPVNSNTLIRIMKAVGLEPENEIDNPSTETESNVIDWQVICEEVLDKQRDANELRRKATGLGAENHVYMPLDLVETKVKKQDRTPNNQDESSNRLKTEEVIYPHAQFLEDLLNWRRENKHIAIAGEAGAGKTTFLVTIAEKLKDSQFLPIFIGLADLQGRSLKTYINDVWLPHAMNEREANEEQKESLFQQFQTGKIWLLLDALDEMQAKSSAEALDRINREIKEVIGQSRVVMTCRLNVWDAYINRLPNFDTFKMGNLSLEQIDSFISQWFSLIKRPKNASILQEKLKEPKRDRIRDMVRHPLRLALLCQAFYLNPKADLPETKAGLYELFVRYFYEWKPNIVDVDLTTQDSSREELHQALGKLAIAAIDSDAGFRLSRSFAVKAMGNSDLFNLACDVGWLNLIDRNELHEEVYSFFHSTFQEYFAAMAIDNHSFLLNHIPNNHFEGSYRVFQAKWREVFLLFLGKRDNELLEQKRLLMNGLVTFKDDCEGFYTERSRLLAAEGTSEFYDFDKVEDVIEKVVESAFGYWNQEEQLWQEFDISVSQLSQITLRHTQRERTLFKIDDLLGTLYGALRDLWQHRNTEPWRERFNKVFNIEFQVIRIIADISVPDNWHSWLVSQLINWLTISSNEVLLDGEILEIYQKVCTGIPEAIEAVEVKISGLRTKISEQKETIRLLRDTTEENETELHMLNWINEASLQNSQVEYYEAIAGLKNTLAKIDPKYNINIVSQRHEELNQCESDTQKIKIIESILRIDPYDPRCVEILSQLSHSDNEDIKLKSYLIKLQTNQYNEEILQYLVEFLEKYQNKFQVAIVLIKAGRYNKRVFEIIFHSCLDSYSDYSDYHYIFVNPEINNDMNFCNGFDIYRTELQQYKDLFKYKQVAIDFLIELIENRQKGYTLAIEFIQDIAANDNSAVQDILVDVIKDEQLELNIRIYAATVLNKICAGHPVSILFLYDFLDNEQYREQALKSLLNVSFSVLKADEKNLLKVKLLYILDNRVQGSTNRFLLEIATLLGKLYPLHNKAVEVIFDFQNPKNLKNLNMICYSLSQIGISDSEIINELIALLNQRQEISQKDLDQIEQRFGSIFPVKRYDDKIYLLYLYDVKRHTVLYCLSKFGIGNKDVLTAFISEYLLNKHHPNVYSDLDKQYIKRCLSEVTSSTNYINFLKIWKSCSSEFSQSYENLSRLNYLVSPDFDRDVVQEELDRNIDHPEIRCLVVDIRQLEQESDPNVIAEEIAIKIFDSLGRQIPEVNRVSNLKRELLNLKRILGIEKLAIALYGNSANEAIAQLCQSLAPIQTRLFTGGQTTEEFITQINAWLSEM